MKKVLFTVLAGVLVGMTFAPARAEDEADKRFEFNGEVRSRYEYLNNYLDLTDNDASGDINDDAYSIAPYRVMIGMTGMFTKNVTGHVDLQYVGHFGDEFNPSKDNPLFLPVPGRLNQGDVPYQRITQGVQLYQGFVDVGKIGGSDFGVRFGRAEHTYGTELFLGDNDYYSGLSFDGARGMWKHGSSDLNVFYYKVDEENCFDVNCTGLAGSSDGNFWGATYDWNFKSMGSVGGYVLISQDNGGFGVAAFPDSKVTTYGVRWNRGMMTGDDLNMFDWNIEYAMQSGDRGEPFGGAGTATDISAWIGEGWFAFNFKAGESHGRVHIGTLMTSGDDTATLDREDFVPLYGDFHSHGRFGDMDWLEEFGVADNTDYNIGYEHWIGANHHVMLAYHMFKATETAGLVTDKIGDEIDLTYDYLYSKNLAFQVTLGQATGDDQFFGFATDPVQCATVMAKLSW